MPRDVFVRRLDPDGSDVWARQFGTTGNDVGMSVAVDASGNILVTGYAHGALEGSNAGGRDAFVRKVYP